MDAATIHGMRPCPKDCILLVGDAPNTNDDFEGIPFSETKNNAGVKRLLKSLCMKHGVPEKYGLICSTNALRCNVGGGKIKDSQIKLCSILLLREINIIQPSIILCFGRHALKAVTGLSKITGNKRQLIPFTLENGKQINVIAVLHPESVRHDVQQELEFKADMDYFVSALAGCIKQPKQIKIVRVSNPNLKTIQDFHKKAVAEKKIIAFDTETNTLKPIRDSDMLIVRCLTISDGKFTYDFEIDPPEVDGDYSSPTKYGVITSSIKEVFNMLENPLVRKAGHNIKYDMNVMRVRFNVRVRGKLYDTCDMDRMLRQTPSGHDLGTISTLYLNAPEYKNETSGASFGSMDYSLLSKRCVRDACYTALLAKVLSRKLKAVIDTDDEALPTAYKSQFNLYSKCLSKAIHAFHDIEYYGMLLNKKYTSSLATELHKRAQTAKAVLRATKVVADYERDRMTTLRVSLKSRKTPPTEDRLKKLIAEKVAFNPGSDAQVIDLLHGADYLGIPSQENYKTAGGAPSVSEEALISLSKKPSLPDDAKFICAQVPLYKSMIHLKSNFVTSVLDDCVGPDNRVHSTFNMNGTRTGRVSSSEPNVQNIPKKNDWEKLFRNMYVAPKGYTLIEADYAQMELMILAAYTKDPSLINIFSSGRDLHTETARKIFGIAPDQEVSSDKRRYAKTINFGIVYGKTPVGLAEDLSITLDEAQDFLNLYFATFPGIPEWQDRVKHFATRTGYVTTMFGNIRYIPGAQIAKNSRYGSLSRGERSKYNAAMREAVNTPIQGTAGKAAVMSVTRLVTEFKRIPRLHAHVINSVHDSALVECKTSNVKAVAAVMSNVMSKEPYKYIGAYLNNAGIKLRVDIKHGTTWGDMHELNMDF